MDIPQVCLTLDVVLVGKHSNNSKVIYTVFCLDLWQAFTYFQTFIFSLNFKKYYTNFCNKTLKVTNIRSAEAYFSEKTRYECLYCSDQVKIFSKCQFAFYCDRWIESLLWATNPVMNWLTDSTHPLAKTFIWK